jgi:hypothetical protein
MYLINFTKKVKLKGSVGRAACKRHDEKASLRRTNKKSVLLFFDAQLSSKLYTKCSMCHGEAPAVTYSA